jgi:hypothetical protein
MGINCTLRFQNGLQFFLFFLKKISSFSQTRPNAPNIIDLPAPVSPVIIENPFEKSMLNFLLTHSFLSIKWLSLMMYFYIKFKFIE